MGPSSGIGEAIPRQLASRGARCVPGARHEWHSKHDTDENDTTN